MTAHPTPAAQQIDTADIVRHEPSGEEWVVACVNGEYLSWAGWPEGRAKLADCTLVRKATPEKRELLLQDLARINGSDHRCAHARAVLAAAQAPQPEPANSPAMVRKSLSATVADALRPFLGAGQKVIWREPFRWHDDDGVMSNHYDGMSLDSLAAEFDYWVIEDCGCAGIIQRRTKV